MTPERLHVCPRLTQTWKNTENNKSQASNSQGDPGSWMIPGSQAGNSFRRSSHLNPTCRWADVGSTGVASASRVRSHTSRPRPLREWRNSDTPADLSTPSTSTLAFQHLSPVKGPRALWKTVACMSPEYLSHQKERKDSNARMASQRDPGANWTKLQMVNPGMI